MKPAQSITRASLSIVILTAGILAISAPAEPDHSATGKNNRRDHGYQTLVFDVALDGRTLSPVGVENVAPEGEDPIFLPVRGATFILDGLILPGGTLPAGNDLVVVDDYATESIGAFLCRGNFIHSYADIVNVGAFPHVASTQQFFFGEDGIVEDEELITEGNEGGTTTQRVVTGGTGKYRGMSGEVTQEPLGLNDTGLFNYRFTFKIKKKG